MPFCYKCGAELDVTAESCKACGWQVNTKITENASGRGALSPVPRAVQGWSWGAFGLGWIWGACHNVWVAFTTLIPGIGLVMMFVLGARGREWAWQRRRWESVADFEKSQQRWDDWGVLAVVVQFGLWVSLIAWLTVGW